MLLVFHAIHGGKCMQMVGPETMKPPTAKGTLLGACMPPYTHQLMMTKFKGVAMTQYGKAAPHGSM